MCGMCLTGSRVGFKTRPASGKVVHVTKRPTFKKIIDETLNNESK
jgi:hypothetical protein